MALELAEQRGVLSFPVRLKKGFPGLCFGRSGLPPVDIGHGFLDGPARGLAAAEQLLRFAEAFREVGGKGRPALRGLSSLALPWETRPPPGRIYPGVFLATDFGVTIVCSRRNVLWRTPLPPRLAFVASSF